MHADLSFFHPLRASDDAAGFNFQAGVLLSYQPGANPFISQ
jgi:hypothetical protein